MNQTTVWVEFITEPHNLQFSTVVALNGTTWDVIFANGWVKAISRGTFPIPQNHADEDMEKTMNQMVGHLRNLTYFALSLDAKWGYEGGYQGTQVGHHGDIFPSIHQQSSRTYDDEAREKAEKKAKRIITDIGSSRRKGLKTMLNYWRRAKELDSLGFDSEAYLNYYKILECLADLNTDDTTKKAIKDRFCPSGKPQASLKKRFGAKTANDEENLCRQINFLAKALSAAGSSAKVSRELFIKLLELVYKRHRWNVAHKLVRPNPYDQYDAIGQHSDEFSLVMLDNLAISKITKLLVLNYVKPRTYYFDNSEGIPIVTPRDD